MTPRFVTAKELLARSRSMQEALTETVPEDEGTAAESLSGDAFPESVSEGSGGDEGGFSTAEEAGENLIQAGTETDPYYTNSSQLPVGYTDDPFEALDLQASLQSKYTGGTVLHLYMSQRISSAKVCGELIKKVLTNYRLPYITITPTFSICPKHGYLAGEHKFCPICDEEKKAAKIKALKASNVA